MTCEAQVVVGAVIVDAGRVLAARRVRPPNLAGLWEFPGGKVEHGEDPREALVREIREELSPPIAVSDEIVSGDTRWRISDHHVLRLYLASVMQGEAQVGADHDALQWLTVDELDSVEWLAADRLALPAVHLAITSRP